MGINAATLPHLFFQQAKTQRDRIALRRKEFGIWNHITWDEYGKMVKKTAAGLIHAGLQPGDRVAILGDNRPEWLVCHVAAMAIGCVTCGVYSTNAPEQVAYVMGHSESKLLFVENEEQVDKVLQIYKDLEKLKNVVVWDPKGLWGFSHEGIMFWNEFLEQGDAYLQDNHKKSDRKASSPIESLIRQRSSQTGDKQASGSRLKKSRLCDCHGFSYVWRLA